MSTMVDPNVLNVFDQNVANNVDPNVLNVFDENVPNIVDQNVANDETMKDGQDMRFRGVLWNIYGGQWVGAHFVTCEPLDYTLLPQQTIKSVHKCSPEYL